MEPVPINALLKETPESSLSAQQYEDRKKVDICKVEDGPHQTGIHWHLDFVLGSW